MYLIFLYTFYMHVINNVELLFLCITNFALIECNIIPLSLF